MTSVKSEDCSKALQIYSKTVELGLPLEPSYVVERYLDAQRPSFWGMYGCKDRLYKLYKVQCGAPKPYVYICLLV